VGGTVVAVACGAEVADGCGWGVVVGAGRGVALGCGVTVALTAWLRPFISFVAAKAPAAPTRSASTAMSGISQREFDDFEASGSVGGGIYAVYCPGY
jgi:hypothetical protein